MEAALALQQAGNMLGAIELHLQATVLAPRNPTILTVAADALRHTGRLREANALFDRALALDPNMIAAWYGQALALESSGDLVRAEQCFHRVTELAPRTPAGFAGLASLQARLGNLESARANVARAAALGPNEPGTVVAQARCDLLARNYTGAVLRLGALADRPDLLPQDRVLILSLLGNALDNLDDREGAFDAFVRAERRFAEAHGGPNAPPLARLKAEEIESAVKRLGLDITGTWSKAPGEARRHIFLLGFPRSGTTLVEQVMGTIEGVKTLEEEPTLALAADKYLTGQGIAKLASLHEDELASLRTDYWERVRNAGVDVSGGIFVDMDPMKTSFLPLIARLFPDSKIVMMRRDPRDVVWSCFRQPFAYSPATYEFTTLERTALYYDAVMRLARTCFSVLPLQVFDLRYETLVYDFDATTRELCDFLDLPWSERLRDFPQRARTALVKTASAEQVTRPLYDGSGQWERYADRLEPVLPILAPWL